MLAGNLSTIVRMWVCTIVLMLVPRVAQDDARRLAGLGFHRDQAKPAIPRALSTSIGGPDLPAACHVGKRDRPPSGPPVLVEQHHRQAIGADALCLSRRSTHSQGTRTNWRRHFFGLACWRRRSGSTRSFSRSNTCRRPHHATSCLAASRFATSRITRSHITAPRGSW